MSNRTPFISRRSLLKGLSIAPLAFSPLVAAQRALAAPGGAKPRLLLVSIHHGPGGPGMVMPGGTETNFKMKPWLSPLEQIKQHVTLVDGVMGTWWGDAHKVSFSHLFTGSLKPGAANFSAPRSASLDYYIEKQLGGFPIGTLRIQTSNATQTSGSVCFDSNNKALAMHNVYGANQLLLNNLAGIKTNGLRLRHKSILDGATKDIKALSGRISGEERRKLQSQLNDIQQVTSQLGLGQQTQTGGNCQKPAAIKQNTQFTQEKEFDLALEHIRLAFTCGLTQTAVLHAYPLRTGFPWVDSQGKQQNGYPMTCGAKPGFHSCIAHYGGDKDRRLAFEGAVRHYIQKFADLALKLDQIKESNGKTMLENTIILITGEVGDGNHERRHKPNVIIGGRGAPGLKTGRYIKPQATTQQYLNGGIDGKINLGTRSRSTRSEVDVLRELAQAVTQKPLQTFGSSYLNMGKVGLI